MFNIQSLSCLIDFW